MTTPTDYLNAHGACPTCGLMRRGQHDCHDALGAIVHRLVERVILAGRREHIALLRDVAAMLEDRGRRGGAA